MGAEGPSLGRNGDEDGELAALASNGTAGPVRSSDWGFKRPWGSGESIDNNSWKGMSPGGTLSRL